MCCRKVQRMYLPVPGVPRALHAASPDRWVPDPANAEPHLLHRRAIPVSGSRPNTLSLFTDLGRALSRLSFANEQPSTGLFRRTSVKDTNVTIGIVVGVLLAVFLAAAFAFMWIYRGSIKLARRRRRHHRKSGSSKSSKASSDGGGAPPAPPPAPAA